MGTKIETDYEDVVVYRDAIPRGEYLARLIDVEETESSKGNPMLVWDWELMEDFPGATVRGWTSLLPQALSSAREYFEAIGKTWKVGDDLERIARRMIKKAKVTLVVSVRTYRDRESGEEKETNSIIGIYPASKGAKPAVKGRDKVNASPGKGMTDVDDDDIPF